MRGLVLPLVLTAHSPTPAVPPRDVSDFCGVPLASCGKVLVDEHGQGHRVPCGPDPEPEAAHPSPAVAR